MDIGTYVRFEPIFGVLRKYAAFLPIGKDKAPTCGSPKYNATADPEILECWSRQERTAGFAAHIGRGSRLLVIDLDQKNGKDGFYSLYCVLMNTEIKLPAGPVTRTPNGGRHLVLRCPPRSPKVISQVGAWDGIDIIAEGGQFILPGSVTKYGEYKLAEGSLDNIPEAPYALLKAIHERQAETAAFERKRKARNARLHRSPLPYNDVPECLTPQQRFRLFRNTVFRSFWTMGKDQGDCSPSAYDFHLAKAAYCVGLDTNQVTIVVKWWHKHHAIPFNEKRFHKSTVRKAWREAAPYVVEWKIRHAPGHTIGGITTEQGSRRRAGRPLSARTELVLALADEHPDWGTGQIAAAAVVSHRAVWNVLHRHRPGRQDVQQAAPPEMQQKAPAMSAAA